jgi:hypothetical protein
LQHAQKTWYHVQELIQEKYTFVPEGDKEASATVLSIPGASNTYQSHTYRRGFENGFQFSSDFKYIVPKPAPEYHPQYPNWYFTPATAPVAN